MTEISVTVEEKKLSKNYFEVKMVKKGGNVSGKEMDRNKIRNLGFVATET